MLVALARRESAAYNDLQALLTAAPSVMPLDANRRRMGRRGANLHLLGANLLNLPVQFRAANQSLSRRIMLQE